MTENLTTRLIGLINRELYPSHGEDVQITSLEANNDGIVLATPAWILGTCMQALQQRNHSEWDTVVDIYNWICTGAKRWGKTPEVIAGLVPLARMRWEFYLFDIFR